TNTAFPYRSDTTLYQTSWRNDYRLDDGITLTSLTSYARFHLAYGQDPDGTPFHYDEVIDKDGWVSAFFQELRAAGRQESFNWLIGANYAHDDVKDKPLEFFSDDDASHLLQAFDPQAFADEGLLTGRMRVNTYAVFGRLEYDLADDLTLEGAVRYNAD